MDTKDRPIDAELAERVRGLVDDVAERRERGEPVDDARVIADHPELMPALAEELAALTQIRRARLAARRAGPISERRRPPPAEAPGASSRDDHAAGRGPRVPIVGYRVLR